MPTAPLKRKETWRVNNTKNDSWSSYGANSFNYQSKEWKQTRAEVIKEQPICVSCKAKCLTRLTKVIDHIIPLQEYKGNPLDKSNLQGLCKECDDIKRGLEVQARLKR